MLFAPIIDAIPAKKRINKPSMVALGFLAIRGIVVESRAISRKMSLKFLNKDLFNYELRITNYELRMELVAYFLH